MIAKAKLVVILVSVIWSVGILAMMGLPYGRLDWVGYASLYYGPPPAPLSEHLFLPLVIKDE